MKKVVVLFLALVMMLVAGIGCSDKGETGNNPSVDGPFSGKTLNLTIAKLGYGTDWLNKIVEAYSAKSGVKVNTRVKIGTDGVTAISTELGSMISEQDIYVTKIGNIFADLYRGQVSYQGVQYDSLYADLTDVYNTTVDGENKTIKEKFDNGIVEHISFNDKYYYMPWSNGFMGIVRNINTWNKLGLTDDDIPNTTKELFALCDTIKSKASQMTSARDKDIAPFIYASSDEYYSAVVPLWFAQYEGKNSISNFMKGLDPEGKVSYNLYAYDGQTEALNALNQLLKNGYQHAGSTSMSFTEMQSYFLAGQAVFCVNGDWLEIEMGSSYKNVTADYIKFPIISSIIDKLSFNTDSELSQLIDYVDSHMTVGDNSGKPAFATDNDVEIVREARTMSFSSSGDDHTVIVPSYSKNIDVAKDFLKFMYSDEGLNIYYDVMKGAKLPLTPTTGYTEKTSLSPFRKSINFIMSDNLIFNFDTKKTKMYSVCGVSPIWRNGLSTSIVNSLLDGKSVESIMTTNNNTIMNNWNNIFKYL